jgi:hypothetical protein
MVDDGNFDEGKQLPVDSELPVDGKSPVEDDEESRKTIIMTDKNSGLMTRAKPADLRTMNRLQSQFGRN